MSSSSQTLTEKIRAQFARGAGLPWSRFASLGSDNDSIYRAKNYAGSNQLELWGTDALDNVLIGNAVSKPFATPIRCQIQANGKITTNAFFANYNDKTPLEIVGIDCIFSVANGAALTGYVCKESSGANGTMAPGAGATCMSGTFDLNATANTKQSATLAGAIGYPSLVIGAGEQLSLKLSTTVTSLAGLYVTVYVRPHTGASIAQYSRAANGDIATGTMYLNLIPGQVVRGVSVRWSTAATNAGAVTVDVTKDTSTNAPGAGSSILAAAQSVKGAINTTVYPTLGTTALCTMAAGDRLAVKMTGTLTALAGLVVTVFFSSSAQEHIVVPISFWDAPSTDRTLFIAESHYIVTDYWETWSVASASLTQLLTKDTGTTAPGGGTGLLTDNTNTGILTSATANTPAGSLTLSAVSTKPTLWLAPGDRLGVKNAGTATGIAGVFAAIVLRRP